MTTTEIASKVFTTILPIFKSKSLKKIGGDFSEAINNEVLAVWEIIKPVFIKEEVLQDLEKDPENKTYQKGFEYTLLKKLQNDEQLTNDLVQLLNKTNADSSKNVIHQKHSGSGDNVGGNKIING